MEKAIVDILENDANVSAVVGDRIFPIFIPQEKAFPAITYERIDTDPKDTKDGLSTLDMPLIDIDLWGKDFKVLKDLARDVRKALDRFSGRRQSVEIQSIQFDNEIQAFSDEKELHHLTQTYRVRQTGPVFDVNASNFFRSAIITDLTEKNAVDIMVSSLKDKKITAKTLWDKMKCLNPVSATGLEAARFNLKNPNKFKMDWFENPTHAPSGVAGNAVDAYGDLNYNPVTEGDSITDWSFGVYVNTNVNNGIDIGTLSLAPTKSQLISSRSADFFIWRLTDGARLSANIDSKGFWIVTVDSTNETSYKDGVQVNQFPIGIDAFADLNMFVLAVNTDAGAGVGSFTGRRHALYFIAEKLNAAEVAALNTIVQTYQTNVISGGRQV